MSASRFTLKELQETISIASGYSFRNKIENESHGETNIVQLKDIDYDRLQILPELTQVEGSKINDRYILRHNDVLFIAKGSNNFAIVYKDIGNRTVASSVFFVIRCGGDWLLPDYFAWYLNQTEAQNYFRSTMEGTYTHNISKTALLELEIVCPSLEVQSKIAATDKLLKKELEILTTIKSKRKQIIDYQLTSLLK